MSALSIQPPFPIFTETDGLPLEDGYVWIGQVNLDPQGNPIQVYWDAALTIPAAQPIRTLGGYPSNSGTPARLYVNSDYSIQVQNKNGSVVYSAPTATERYSDVVIAGINASQVVYDPAGAGAVQTDVETKLREAAVSVLDYGADATGVASSTQAFIAALATGKSVYVPQGTYRCGLLEMTTQGQQVFGDGSLSIIVQESTNQNLFFAKAAYIGIRNLRLNGIETNAANSSFAIFTAAATPAQFLTVEDVLFSGSSGATGFNNAIKFDDGCNYGRVVNCNIESLWGNTSNRGYGVLAGNVVGCRVTKNVMTAVSGRGRHGIYFSAGCSDSVADGNYLTGFDQEGISQYSTGVQPTCARNIYSNNTLTNCSASTNPFSGAIGIYQHSYGCIIANNTITASGQKGIAIDGSSVTDCANTLIIGNTVSYSGTNGIDLTSTVRCSVIGNIVYESSTASAGASANIMLRQDGATACVDTLIEGNMSAGSTYARSAISIDPGPPAPSLLKLQFNDFRPCVSYTLELNGVNGIEIDGRLQFRFQNVGYGPIANGASFAGPLSLPGADQGDICTVSHDQNSDGCTFYVYCNVTNTGVLNIGNLSGGSKTIASGNLRVDVWKRNAPL
jgi:parallel beta-helix repeat protein